MDTTTTSASPATPPSGFCVRGHVIEWWMFAIVAGFVAFCTVFIARTGFEVDGVTHFSLFDDAMISMRYARNLADGNGLVWNADGPAVEGYSNLLWTLYMAVLHVLPISSAKLPLLVTLTGVGLLVANLFVVRAIAARLAPDSRAVPVAAVVLTATFYPLAYWALRGMEVGLLALLVSVSVLLALRLRDRADDAAHSRDLWWLAVVFAAMVVTRTDALLPCVLVAAFVVFVVPASTRLRVAAVLVGSIVATTAALTIFRVAYYGDALPNTYYLKLSGISLGTRVSQGFDALRQVAVVQLFAAVALASLAIAALRRTRDLAIVLLAALVLGQCAYSVYAGGDAFETFSFANRYVTIVAPALFLLGALGIGELVRGPAQRSARLLGWLLVGLGVGFLALRELGRADPPRGFVGALIATIPDIDRFATPLAIAAAVCLVVGGLLCCTGIGPDLLGRAGRAVGGLVHRGGVVTALVVCAIVIVLTNQQALRTWYRHNASSVDTDNALAAGGLLIRDATNAKTSVAVFFAGNGPYFSEREGIDLLGKNDAHIARLPSATDPFIPGHSKFDNEYSINRLRPDVVDFGPTPGGFTPEQVRELASWGYLPVGLSTFVRIDATGVNRDRLAEIYEGERIQR
jgi:hypothetical protein